MIDPTIITSALALVGVLTVAIIQARSGSRRAELDRTQPDYGELADEVATLRAEVRTLHTERESLRREWEAVRSELEQARRESREDRATLALAAQWIDVHKRHATYPPPRFPSWLTIPPSTTPEGHA